MENQEVKKYKTKAEYVEMLKREFYEVESIMENVSEIKGQAKDAGFDATLLAKIAKALAENKADDIIDKNTEFARCIDEVRNS